MSLIWRNPVSCPHTRRHETLASPPHSYWDSTLDVSDIYSSPVLDNTLGLGGDGEYNGDISHPFGSVGGGCIAKGPFKTSKVHIGVGTDTGSYNRCITRDLQQIIASGWLTLSWEALTQSQVGYSKFSAFLEGDIDFVYNLGMHNAGHGSVGGDVSSLSLLCIPTYAHTTDR